MLDAGTIRFVHVGFQNPRVTVCTRAGQGLCVSGHWISGTFARRGRFFQATLWDGVGSLPLIWIRGLSQKVYGVLLMQGVGDPSSRLWVRGLRGLRLGAI